MNVDLVDKWFISSHCPSYSIFLTFYVLLLSVFFFLIFFKKQVDVNEHKNAKRMLISIFPFQVIIGFMSPIGDPKFIGEFEK